MKYLIYFFFFCQLYATSPDPQKVDIKAVSKTMGHLYRKDLKSIGVQFDLQSVIEGLKEADQGKYAPMSEEDCMNCISLLQEQNFDLESEKNLEQATAFLRENIKKEGIQQLVEDKLQIRILNEGNGDSIQEFHSPLIRYRGTYLNGEVFGESQEGEIISIDDTLPGFRKGILGMKKNEKRVLYVHPKLGYGKSGFLKPNALLIYEVEIIETDVNPEIKNPFKNTEIVN